LLLRPIDVAAEVVNRRLDDATPHADEMLSRNSEAAIVSRVEVDKEAFFVAMIKRKRRNASYLSENQEH
jgi:fructose-1,6-bisphosphatase/inositol monophosphatase family enzyme